ncbi:MAG: ATP-binding cassette domain-containing protein [Deltaproteobacteria bacterium]|nr:ATP-binding cassette domain-containing protein [Deltaproteobacteria bacterium]
MPSSIEISNIIKKFGALTALDGVSFNIDEGEFFGLLGPNGAGKTTLIRILTTLIKPTSGSAKIMGIDAAKKPGEVRKRIGVVPQAMTTDLDLTGMENMDIYARFYDMPKRERHERINHLLELVGLKDRADELVATYSGGMRRRLEIARGLVHKPSILILDEPTLGLDPQSRHVVWELLQKFRSEDKLTILLTTHYMDEAETLCSRVAIIDYGKIVAMDTVDGLKKQISQKDVVEIAFSGIDNSRAEAEIKTISFVHTAAATGGVIRVSADNGAAAIPSLVHALKKIGANVASVVLKQQTLEDVFIHFTGRPIREEEVKKVSYLIGAGIPSKWGR